MDDLLPPIVWGYLVLLSSLFWALSGVFVLIRRRSARVYERQDSAWGSGYARGSVDAEVQQAAEVLLGPETRVLEMLGWGSFGRVYRMFWSGQEVALKINIQNCTAGTIPVSTEGLFGKSLRHSNLVASYMCCQRHQTIETTSLEPAVDEGRQNIYSSDMSTTEAMRTAVEGRGIGWEVMKAPPPPERANHRVSLDLSRADSCPTSVSIPSDIAEQVPSETISLDVIETWIVMEFMDMGSLRSSLTSKHFRYSPNRVKTGVMCKTAIEVARGLQHLHHNQIVHGDLTSKNIMLKTDSRKARGFTAKIGDFGLSRALSDNDQTHQTTNTFGCVTHMAPEVLLSGKVGTKADVYSFGIILWEMYTSRYAYAGLRPGEVIHRVVQRKERPVFPPTAPAALRSVASRCWEVSPSMRPSWSEIISDLKKIMNAPAGNKGLSLE